MAIEPPVVIPPAPPAPDRSQPPEVFAALADPFVDYQFDLGPHLNALAANVNNNALAAYQISLDVDSIRDATQAIADEALRASRRETQRATWAADDAEDFAAGATQQAQLAAAAAAGAQASAAAAGAAAGLPAFAGKGGFPARVRADEQGLEYVPAASLTVITTSQTWTKPAWASWIEVEGEGGGAGGGAVRATSTTAGGGNGGRYNRVLLRASDVPATVNAVVGAGGLGQIAAFSSNPNFTSRSRTAGGDSTFGSFLTCPGGALTSLYAHTAYDGGLGDLGSGGGPGSPTKGGGGGGGCPGGSGSTSHSTYPGGPSIDGGNGGTARVAASAASDVPVTANDGAPRGGGGGAARNTETSNSAVAIAGNGGRGEIRIKCW